MSLDLDDLKVFVRVARLASFTQAAAQLGMPKARASAQVQRLEAALGVRLLARSTRLVRPTPEGEELLRRATPLLAEADELSALFQAGRTIRGAVRVELPIGLAREFVIPRVPELLEKHPQLQLAICASDRFVAAAREGYDVVLRVGVVDDPSLTGRRIGALPMANYVGRAYAKKHGVPLSLDDLRDHFVVHYAVDAAPVFEHVDDDGLKEVPMQSLLTVDNVDTYVAACIAGLGIIQVPRHPPERTQHELIEVLPGHVARSMPVSLLHTHGRAAPRRVRVVMAWLATVLAPSFD